MTRSADSLARDHTEQAIKVLGEIIADDSVEETKHRIAAAKELLDRGHGKPLNAVIQVPTSRQQAQRLAAMSDEELQAALRSTPLPQLAAPQLYPEEMEAIAAETAAFDISRFDSAFEDVTNSPLWQRRVARGPHDAPPSPPALDHEFDPLLD